MTTRAELEIGRKAPDFTLPDQNDRPTGLGDFRGRWLVLYFYPKDNTSGCTTEACEFTEGIEAFRRLKAAVVGVSPDSTASHRGFIDKHRLNLTLLSDRDKEVMGRYGAFGAKKMYGKEVQGVIRSTFLIDPDGHLAFIWANVKAAGHAARVQAKLEELAVRRTE